MKRFFSAEELWRRSITKIDDSKNLQFLLLLFLITSFTILFFKDHLSGKCSFTWDFVSGYHPVTSYLVEHFKRGIWPVWLGQQSLGYPLYMSPQIDFYYPVTWFFALFDIPYTVVYANIVAILHICLAAIGMWLLLLKHHVGWRLSMVFALGYFIMGGFFSGSQHVDMARGYAFTPWCFWIMSMRYPPGLSIIDNLRSLLLVALIFALYFAGAYPGQIVSLGVILFLYHILIIFRSKYDGVDHKMIIHSTMIILLGVMMASCILIVKYMPFFIEFSEEAARAGNMTRVAHAHFKLATFFTLFLDNYGRWAGNVSISNHFITAPLFCSILFLNRKVLKTIKIELALLFVAFFISSGWVYKILGEQSGLLMMSRMTIADYKGIFVTLFLLVGALSLKTYGSADKKPSVSGLIIRTFIFSIIYWFGIAYVKMDVRHVEIIGYLAGLTTILLYSVRTKWNHGHRGAVLLCVLMLVSAIVVHFSALSWRDFQYREKFHYHAGFDIFKDIPDADWIFQEVDRRPKREDLGHYSFFTSRGFYTGMHIIKGYDGSKNLNRHKFLWEGENFDRLTHKTDRIRFFELEGLSCILPDHTASEEIETVVSNIVNNHEGGTTCDQVSQEYYSLRESVFTIDADRPFIMLENELYWNGWQANLQGKFPDKGPQQKKIVEPDERYAPYRVWRLPPGQYNMTVRFYAKPQTLAFKTASYVLLFSIGAILLWLFFHPFLFNLHRNGQQCGQTQQADTVDAH